MTLTLHMSSCCGDTDKDINTVTELMDMHGFIITEKSREDVYHGNFWDLTFSIEEKSIVKNSGGRPRKLTADQVEEIRHRLSEPECNKSALGREYGVSYQTIHKLSV